MDIIGILISLTILLFSAILHEIAHGFVADRLGDPTARLMKRLTLNPKNHIDLFLTIILPIISYLSSGGRIIFGGAKPVPIDPFNLKEGRKDEALVALAGPLTNIIIAVLISFLIKGLLAVGLAPFLYSGIIGAILFAIIQINIWLAIFNLLPIPPLDGSRLFSLLLPEKEARAYLSLGSIGIVILLFLLYAPLGGFSLGGLLIRIMTFAQNLLLP